MFTSEVVLTDLFASELTDHRLRRHLQPSFVETRSDPDHRAPELWLRDITYSAAVDIWAIGAVTAYVHSGWRMFQPRDRNRAESMNRLVEVVGYPDPDVANGMKALPGYKASRKQGVSWWRYDNKEEFPEFNVVDCLLHNTMEKEPKTLDFMESCLRWDPCRRPSAEAALSDEFYWDVPLSVVIAAEPAKNGLGSLVNGKLRADLLAFLQGDEAWSSYYAPLSNQSRSVSKAEAAKGHKKEFASYLDEAAPPKCRSLNSDKNLEPLRALRMKLFVKALRKKLKQFGIAYDGRVRDVLERASIPLDYVANLEPFLYESLADNMLQYVSPQLMDNTNRCDTWHSDGGTSLLHAAVTLFGTRELHVKTDHDGYVKLKQEPGSFYIGNMVALRHAVYHDADEAGCFIYDDESETAVLADRCNDSNGRLSGGQSTHFGFNAWPAGRF